MQKFVFYKKSDLENLIVEAFLEEGSVVNATFFFDEEEETDMIKIDYQEGHTKNVPLQHLVGKIAEHLRLPLTHHDEIEAGEHGEGFAFFF